MIPKIIKNLIKMMTSLMSELSVINKGSKRKLINFYNCKPNNNSNKPTFI